MGGELVKTAYAALWHEDARAAAALALGQPTSDDGGSLPAYRGPNSNERAVLIYLCAIAIDTDAPPRYWGGRDAIARHALGRVVPDGDDAESTRARRSIHESVRQAIEALAAWGAIERIGGAFPGRQQEYAIRVAHLYRELSTAQEQLGPFTSCPWPIRKASLRKTQAHLGPETKNTNNQERHQDHLPAATYVLPVDNTQAESGEVA